MTDPSRPVINEQIKILETRVRHLTNELSLTREEHDLSAQKYLEIHFLLDKKVQERTAELEQVNNKLRDEIKERIKIQGENERLIQELQKALAEIKTLQGIIPICSSCKKIRDDEGIWNQIELYFNKHSDAQFSHGLCPDCIKKIYPDLDIEDDPK